MPWKRSWRAWKVWRRDLDVYLTTWKTNFLPPLLEPVFYVLAFGLGLGSLIGDLEYYGREVSYLRFMVPGVAAVTPSIVDAVGDRAEVFLDGGIRRGEDIVKARALGATAASGGRLWFWGLAAGGQDGVRRVLSILEADVDRTLALIGRRRYDDVGPDVVHRPHT